ncbi:hypothetical protein [Mycolicibacterium mucogenicum]|jgi:hypothetical protein|nr:hypothetical protein [Mycolicibacterium mucogenicum]
MDTGFGAQQLYSACKIEATHHYPADGTECTPVKGTGFLVQFPTGDGRLGLVTNRHIADDTFFDERNVGSELKSIKVQWWQTKELRCEHTTDDPKPLYHSDPLVDVAIIPLHTEPKKPLRATGEYFGDLHQYMAENTKAMELKYAISWKMLLEAEKLWPQVQPGDFVVFPGYPEQWHDKLQMRPVMRSGLIASDPQTDYRLGEDAPTKYDGGPQVLFDAFSTAGNSGSPVFVAQRGVPPITVVMPDGDGKAAIQGQISWPNYHRPFLVGINATHYNETGFRQRNEHAGLSRFHKLSAIMDILRANQDLSRGGSPLSMNLAIPVPDDFKIAPPS